MADKGAVDLALVMATDVSSSVDAGDFKLQMTGIAAALRNPPLAGIIAQGPLGRIAVTVVHWSRADTQKIAVPWRMLATARDLEAMAHTVETCERQWQPGGTGLAAAILYSAALALVAPFAASERMIDVSGDGEENEHGDVGLARDQAVAAGLTINGLPILTGSPTLAAYYQRKVMGGPGAFVQPARDIFAFAQAMTDKLLREAGAKMA